MTLRELPATWPPEIVERIARAADTREQVEAFRRLAEDGRVSMVANGSAVALYDVLIDSDGDKAATIHAIEGRNGQELIRQMAEAGAAQGVKSWSWKTGTRSRARLYARWFARLARAGVVESYYIADHSDDEKSLFVGRFLTRPEATG